MFHKAFALAAGVAVGTLLLSAQVSAAQTTTAVPTNLAGEWLITQDAGAPGISALSDAEVWSLLGSTFKLDDGTCTTMSDSKEEPWFRPHDEAVQDYTFVCSGKPAVFGMQPQDDSHALILVDGHYFVVAKQTGQTTSADQDIIVKVAPDLPIVTLSLTGSQISYPIDVNEPDLGTGLVGVNHVSDFLMVDGHNTAAAAVSFTFGGTGWGTALCPVYDINGHKIAGECRNGLGEIEVDAVNWQHRGQVIVSGKDHARDDPHCCGTLMRAWEFQLNGTRFDNFARFDLGREGALDFLTAEGLVKYFDMASFPSSVGPQHLAAGTTLLDLGFSVTDAHDPKSVTLENPRDQWRFAFTVLEYGKDAHGENVLVCVEDRNIGGGSYHSMAPVLFHWTAEGDRLIGTLAPATPRCPPLPGQNQP